MCCEGSGSGMRSSSSMGVGLGVASGVTGMATDLLSSLVPLALGAVLVIGVGAVIAMYVIPALIVALTWLAIAVAVTAATAMAGALIYLVHRVAAYKKVTKLNKRVTKLHDIEAIRITQPALPVAATHRPIERPALPAPVLALPVAVDAEIVDAEIIGETPALNAAPFAAPELPVARPVPIQATHRKTSVLRFVDQDGEIIESPIGA
jgi:hypothetical protein